MFHENLKAQRKAKGYTQETLAIKVNVVRQTISKWEKGLSVPDADTLQKLAEVLDVTVSQLLGADPPKEPEDRNEIAEQLARINEQLAIKNRRAGRIWKCILILLILLIVLPALLSAGLAITRITNATDQNQAAAGKTEWSCMLDGREYIYSVEYNDSYQIITASCDEYAADHLDTENYTDANQLAAHIEDYFTGKGGTVTVTLQEGMALNAE